MINLFKKEKTPRNLKSLLSEIESLKKQIKNLSEELERLKKESKFSIQKVGLVRFNPFKETGGDQSFSAAFLDSHNNGVIITSLYGREGNRIYGKPIKKGKSEYILSLEEKKAIEKAKTSKGSEELFNNNGKK